jgi:methylenetetrahydrofolate reductase (NADPH)
MTLSLENDVRAEHTPMGQSPVPSSIPSRAFRNQIRESLAGGRFLYTLEYVPDLTADGRRGVDAMRCQAEAIASDARIAGINIGDRVKAIASFDTVDCGRIAADASGKVPLLHLAGKDRTPEQARAVIARALDQGLENLLLLTGDGVQEPRHERVRYHESVIAIADAKGMAPGCLVAGAISPFKYREEELANQFLKMVKKIHTGVDYLITNCGWDMRKLSELAWYRNARGFHTPLVANLLLPTMGWARGIHSRRLPGVFMSDDLFQKINEEHALGKAQAREIAWHRLALQIVGAQLMGYAGVHLSGVDTHEDLCAAIDMAESVGRKLSSLSDWQQTWDEAHRLADGRLVDFSPPGGLYLFEQEPAFGSLDSLPDFGKAEPSSDEQRKFSRLQTLHHLAFEPGQLGSAVLSDAVRAMNTTRLGSRWLLDLERASKHSVLGCETCGFCRIEHLMYVCPETCPKGLANGPCAGTDENTCEFKDRECIHNRKYRLAKNEGRLKALEHTFVPAVEGTRGTSSWVNHFEGRSPPVIWLKQAS